MFVLGEMGNPSGALLHIIQTMEEVDKVHNDIEFDRIPQFHGLGN